MKKIMLCVLAISLMIFLVSVAQSGIREAKSIKTPVNHMIKGDCTEEPTYPEPDSIIITVNGNNITVMHADALYNCCLNIDTEVVQQGFVINLYEDEWGEDPCYCLCYYDLETTVYDLLPGTYTINVYNDQGEYVGGGTATIEGGKGPDPALK
jgi:hypothetical protein